jgi:hypothetical protein
MTEASYQPRRPRPLVRGLRASAQRSRVWKHTLSSAARAKLVRPGAAGGAEHDGDGGGGALVDGEDAVSSNCRMRSIAFRGR